VPTGELPRNVLLSIDRHLVQTIVPGTRLTVVGIYSVYQASAKYDQLKLICFLCYSGGQVHHKNSAVFILQPEGCFWS
jgi:DNA replicative helicase MCM subunit Mcm2 (Cdc46/Mcm family)